MSYGLLAKVYLRSKPVFHCMHLAVYFCCCICDSLHMVPVHRYVTAPCLLMWVVYCCSSEAEDASTQWPAVCAALSVRLSTDDRSTYWTRWPVGEAKLLQTCQKSAADGCWNEPRHTGACAGSSRVADPWGLGTTSGQLSNGVAAELCRYVTNCW